MRYRPQHKTETHRKIVEDAARRLRSEGLSGAAVSAVMRDAGLTHGGFYKHFRSKDELLMESLAAAFQQMAAAMARAAEKAQPGAAWKAIVNLYLSPQHCDHAECGCPLAALAPELARAGQPMKDRILQEMTNYQAALLPHMPGRTTIQKRRAFLAIISTLIGAVALARILPDPQGRARVLVTARNFLLRSF